MNTKDDGGFLLVQNKSRLSEGVTSDNRNEGKNLVVLLFCCS